MKKLVIASMFLLCLGGTVLAQTTPPKQEPAKKETKAKTETKTSMGKHHHAKKHKKTGSKQG